MTDIETVRRVRKGRRNWRTTYYAVACAVAGMALMAWEWVEEVRRG